MKLSQMFGKIVESASGRSGYIISVNACENRITSITCADRDELEFDIPAKNIKSIKDTVIYSYAGHCGENEKSVRLGRPVFDCEGNFIGKLTDITYDKFLITHIYVGNKKFSADDVICGDAVIIKNNVRFLKSDVMKNGKIIFKRGTPLTDDVAEKAQMMGEYVQTNLKTIN
ncbi:MAG: hypothetical protein K2N23_07050 [Clostridia bacterium]|nr:hypothetical protein [Clostridia bacterium]